MNVDGAWLEPVTRLVNKTGMKGGFILIFPEYRPDLAKAVAHRLSLRFFDYREEELRRLGAAAYKIELSDLDAVLERLAHEGGAVVFNVEALLATKEETERARWLSGFLEADWPGALVLPLTLFARQLTGVSAKVFHLDAETLPEQSLISRFLH